MRRKITIHEPRDDKALLYFAGFIFVWMLFYNAFAIIEDGTLSWWSIVLSIIAIIAAFAYRKKVIQPSLKKKEEENKHV